VVNSKSKNPHHHEELGNCPTAPLVKRGSLREDLDALARKIPIIWAEF
jgi:hypothetical protein